MLAGKKGAAEVDEVAERADGCAWVNAVCVRRTGDFTCKKMKKGVSLNKERPSVCGLSPLLTKKPPQRSQARAAFFYSFLSLRKVSTDIIASITAAIQITTSIIVSTIPSLPSSFIQVKPVEFGRQPPTNGRNFIV